jgi:two-component system sensor histidine kinase DctS
LVWLAGLYEASQVQGKLERDTADALSDIRSALTRNVQTLQALQSGPPTPVSWSQQASELLREHREWLRIEWRGAGLETISFAESPFRPAVFARLGRANAQADVALACANARRVSGPAYSGSYFLPLVDGMGMEVMELCLPQFTAGQATGYVVATYSLADILVDLVGPQLTRSQEVAFTEADGTRLALHGTAQRGRRAFTAKQLLDLPGNTIMLRMDSWRGAPDLFPNVLTALVTAMSIALVLVLVLLGRDARRRLRAEQDLADALAFSQGHGRFPGHRPAGARPAGPHHLCESCVLPDGRVRGGRAARAGDAGAVLASRTGRRIPEAAEDPPGGPGAAARRLRIGFHAQGRVALSCADHRGAADQSRRGANRLDERLP